ncbi:hypothetical protein LCGC14_0416750 [marine sediment metagenome]|uniref:Uncharacterized protein n=1 Tax=marine sediment metagenome TaxID=412755 RepID=A0A0F9VE42_9ZZZZ
MKVTPAIEAAGYGRSGDIGGLPRQTYYTPDGRTIRAIPSLREYVRKKDGKVVETGTRDANFDKGWLPVMPTDLKPHCPHCGEWHDNQEEVDACALEIKKRTAWGVRLAKKVRKQESDDITSLKEEVAELKEMLEKALEVKSEKT